MKTVLLTALIVTGPAAEAALNCWGMKREQIGPNEIREQKVELGPTFQAGGHVILEGQIEDRAFTVNGDEKTGDFLISITVGPHYTQGVIATTRATSDGRLQISTVDKTTVYKLECREN